MGKIVVEVVVAVERENNQKVPMVVHPQEKQQQVLKPSLPPPRSPPISLPPQLILILPQEKQQQVLNFSLLMHDRIAVSSFILVVFLSIYPSVFLLYPIPLQLILSQEMQRQILPHLPLLLVPTPSPCPHPCSLCLFLCMNLSPLSVHYYYPLPLSLPCLLIPTHIPSSNIPHKTLYPCHRTSIHSFNPTINPTTPSNNIHTGTSKSSASGGRRKRAPSASSAGSSNARNDPQSDGV